MTQRPHKNMGLWKLSQYFSFEIQFSLYFPLLSAETGYRDTASTTTLRCFEEAWRYKNRQ
jgi:hypothetical protein